MRDAKTLEKTKPEVKYLVKHDGLNRAMRRRLAARARIRQKAFETWWRTLERKGIDPRRVLAARKLRESLLSKKKSEEPSGE